MAALCCRVVLGRDCTIELPGTGTVTIGREPDRDIHLADGSVSRHHARLELEGDRGTLTDLGSRNGTSVNGEPLSRASRTVGHGDELTFGGARVTLLARDLLPPSVRPVLLRAAFLARVDAARKAGDEVELSVLRCPRRFSEMDGVSAWLARVPDERPVGMLTDQALAVLASPGGVLLEGLAAAELEIEVGCARSKDEPTASARDLLTAALRALVAARQSVRTRPASRPVATSAAMLAVYEEATKIAPTMVSVLLVGETGVGKEVLARFIHEKSARRGPLVSVNTAALPESLVESELFGHERGAFSGAHQAKVGLVEAATGGTLFLDEIGDLPPSLQAKLLRVLEDRSVRRVGATQERKIDVRVIAATHRDLDRAVAEGVFRRDLFFRVNACTLKIPPLRERMGELERLVEELLRETALARGAKEPVVSRDAMELLRGHAWPGNVRELRNVLDRGAALAGTARVLRPEHLPEYVRAPSGPLRQPEEPPSDVRDAVKDYERQRILEALDKTGGNQSQAAKLLGLPRRTLAYKMARLGIRVAD